MGRLVFISYRRERGYALAHLVNAELRSRGLRTFLDVAESDPGQFWTQARAAIHSCRALVLICTNGSFEARAGEDWVQREIGEAMELGRPIVPVFSQDFKTPSSLPPPFAQALEFNGVSMDTQFHVAAFDHLSELLGGRKRSEQRRRVAAFWGLAVIALLAALAVGARNITRLNAEAGLERQARQAESARSAELAQDLAAIEKQRAAERSAADARQRESEARSTELAQDITGIEKKRADDQRAASQRQSEAIQLTEQRHNACIQGCSIKQTHCGFDCESKNGGSNVSNPQYDQCRETCDQFESLCKDGCQ